MSLFHIPKADWSSGTLLGYTVKDGKHYAEYTFFFEGAELVASDIHSVEEEYGEELTAEVLAMGYPRKITVYYDKENRYDSIPDLLNEE